MTRTDLIDHLRRVAACSAAREWVEATPGTPEELWAACPRGDWLLWLAARAGVDRRVVVLAACDCAEEATPHLTDSARGPALAALETARRWARGEATDMEVRGAADAASYAADEADAEAEAAAYASYAAYAAYAASDAAYAAYAAAEAAAEADAAAYAAYAAAEADAAAYAVSAAVYAAASDAAASDAAAYAASLGRSAGLVRARIPWADVEAALRGGAP